MAQQMVTSVLDAESLFLVTHFAHAFHAAHGCACLDRLPVRLCSTT